MFKVVDGVVMGLEWKDASTKSGISHTKQLNALGQWPQSQESDMALFVDARF
jgi:hypothetical protein